MAEDNARPKTFFDFIEHPFTLTALFALGGLVGTLIYTPFYALCAICLLFGLHRSGYVSAQSAKTQILIYIGAAVALSIGGYFLYGLLDVAVERIQTDFARKVAVFVKEDQPKEPPKSNLPETKESPSKEKKAPRNSVKTKEVPPPVKESLFAVDIEHRIFTTPRAVTSFWFGAFGPSACSLAPVGTAIFLRLTNLQQQKEMITAYSVKGLRKIQVNRGRMFIILPKGKISAGFVPHIVDWGAPAGMGALVTFPVDDADASKAIPVSGDFLDYKIGEGHYLDANESVRGWVFFEYRAGYITIPAQLTIEITDQFQRNFSYQIPDHIGNPEGDILSRRIVELPLEDLSQCAVSISN